VRRNDKPDQIAPWNIEGPLIDANVFAHPGWGAAVTEVEIDPVSLEPRIRGVWLAVAGGQILSQVRARRALKTAVIQALDWTCREGLAYENGVIAGDAFRNCAAAAPSEAPPIFIDFLRDAGEPPNGIGDLPFSCVPAAYTQAVSQAMDHPFERLPLSARDIWEAAQLKQPEAPA
jgi:CO/xanthine dehydrogenase Mo-binding subunit